MIPESFIQDLLNRVDVVDVVGKYVQLKKAGANLQGLCPFHNEKSPSFSVSPTKQFYHCFGCGAHGSAVGFMMEFAGMGYVDAIKDLASGVGMQVPDEARDFNAPPKQSYDTLHEWMARTAKYYQDALMANQRAKDYVNQRGLTRGVGATFQIGYAPDGWDALKEVFGEEYESAAPVDLGLVIEKEATEQVVAKRYDRFRDRIMFPIRNTKGQIIGFGGRILDKGEPKYLNSPETVLFEKGRELYGLFEARKAIRAAQRVLVVEGYMDVVALAQHGVEHAVATLGTACTPMHVQKLLKQADRIIFSFDGDAAGKRAAWRALENALPLVADGKTFQFLFLPEEHDPDTYVREFGKEGFENAERNAMPLSRFLVQHLSADLDLDTAEGRARLLNDAKPHMIALAAPVMRAQLIRLLSDKVEMSPAEVAGACGIKFDEVAERQGATKEWKPKGEWKKGKFQPPAPAYSRAPRRAPMDHDFRLICCLFDQPHLSRDTALDGLRNRVTFTPALADLLTYCDEMESMPTPAVLTRFAENSPNQGTYARAQHWSSEENLEAAAVQTEFLARVRAIQSQLNDSELSKLVAEGIHTPEQREQYRVLSAERARLKESERTPWSGNR